MPAMPNISGNKQASGLRNQGSGGRGWRIVALLVLGFSAGLEAHGVSGKDAVFLQGLQGQAIGPLLYLGAKHMVTGYDHLLFLVGVIFFLYRLRDVLLYVSLFTIGHSTTLLLGVLGGIHANPFLIDAVIGFSVVYKAFENMDGFKRFFGRQIDTRFAVLVFGFFHGFGLATKLQEFALVSERLGGEHRQLQCWRRDRAIPGADGNSHRAHLLAHARRVPAPCVCHQRHCHGVRLPARGVSVVRLLPSGAVIMTTQTGPLVRFPKPRRIQARTPRQDRLAVAAGAALLAAGLILVMFILPAEFAVDPLGTGARIGLARPWHHGAAGGGARAGGRERYRGEAAVLIVSQERAFQQRNRGIQGGAARREWNTSTGSTRARRCSIRGKPPAP